MKTIDLIKYTNKQVKVTLNNGKEISSKIVYIDTLENTIDFEDGRSVASSFVKEIFNGENNNTEQKTNQKETEKTITKEEKKEISPIILQKLIQLETTFDTEIKNISFSFEKPVISNELPEVFKTFDVTGRSSEEAKLWGKIINQYKNSEKIGLNESTLFSLISNSKELAESPYLSKYSFFYNLNGYFYFLNNDFEKSIESYVNACKSENNTEKSWQNLIYLSTQIKNNELTLFSLENLFLKVDINTQYEKYWYKLVDLIIQFSAYDIFDNLIKTKKLSTQEYSKFFESVCYSLLKKGKKKIVETLLEEASKDEVDFKFLVLEGLEALPKKPTISYIQFKLDWQQKKNIKPNVEIKKEVINNFVSLPIIPKNNYKVNNDSNLPYHLQSRVQKGSNAEILKNARIERDVTKNFKKAEELFIRGIENEVSIPIKEKAVRDLASMLGQQVKEPKRAIEVIKKYQQNFSDSDLNLLYALYFQSNAYEEAIKIQKQLLKNTFRKDLKLSKYIGLAACYVELQNFKEAENYYILALKINPSQYNIEINIAFCLYKQGKNEEAKKILNKIIVEYGDAKAQELINIIEGKNNENQQEYKYDDGDKSLDGITKFFLENCDMLYVKDRLENSKYIGSSSDKEQDLKKLEDDAGVSGGLGAETRSQIYLTAARIFIDKQEITNDLYKYLCRSFTSKGDNAIQVGGHIDCVRNYYLIGLRAYNLIFFGQNSSDIIDASYALCRYLYSFLGREHIPFTDVSIDRGVIDVYQKISNKDIFFNSIILLFSRSQKYSMNKISKILFENIDLKSKSCDFLKIPINSSYENFIESWKKQAKEITKKEDELSNQFSPLGNFEIAEVWLLLSIERIKTCQNKVLFNLDKDYLIELERILNNCVALSTATDFDDKNNKVEDIKSKTERLLNDIEKNPTKFSIEEIYPILNKILSSLQKFIQNLFIIYKPELEFSSVFSSYQLKNNNMIDLQIKIENKTEGHAEQVELYLEENPLYFKSINQNSISYNTIKGKKNELKIIELELTEKAIQAKAFSIEIKADFKNRLGEFFTTRSEPLSIELGEQGDFIEVKPNPYANGASGKPVTQSDMFYGRENYINSAYKTMVEDGVSYVIYGQFRSGKSSVLTHLENKLDENPTVIVAKIGDVGKFMGESSIPMFYRFLHRILLTFRDAIQRKIRKENLSNITFLVPDSKSFYEHPSPVDYFYEIMSNLQEQKNNQVDWQNIRLIVSIDEFTYIYGQIVEGKLSDDFMKSWKALLSTNYFNVVLVAQDVFPKFFAQYENAFGTILPKRITYLDNESAKLLIDDPIKKLSNNESRFRENAIDKIIQLTAGHPWYIQIFCNALVDYMNKNRQLYVTGANIEKVKDLLLRGTERKDNFKNFIENGDPSKDKIPDSDFISVLKKIAEHTRNTEDGYCFPSLLNDCKTKFNINEVLKNLESREVIETHGQKGYKIRVGLFKEWLNENPNIWE
ncbi:MAG: hypothetical protein EAZ85_01680 [Bacteroidetes bacterium]|nr:MAG: hypothetical protein EAZ85_01680 [Bacteroidota bacterium]TAG89943.1 MAG: hypothetical protein EAZ20_05425 [Bacteroidota bacterium]